MSTRTRNAKVVGPTTICLCIMYVFVIAASCPATAGDADQKTAERILSAAGVTGGLVVHIGCGDGRLTAALRANDSFLVHGLDADPGNVAKAREHIRALGLYGKVSVDHLRADRLPYVDNLANLIVSEDLGGVPMAEVMRVLCPQGVAYIKEGREWTKAVKPRPAGIDEWTHYLHDASGNAVAHDSVVGPPRQMQWLGSPRWARHHDRMASMSALVATGGRIFYIFDEGPTASVQLPSKWALIARDAFNGTILWKRAMSKWHPHLYPFKSGPAQLPRRLVAVGDRVYVTLALDAPLTALDAATGETVWTCEGSRATEEVIASEGVLFLQVTGTPVEWDEFKPLSNNVGAEKTRVAQDWPWNEKTRRVVAVNADTGEVLWRQEHPVVPLTLAADAKGVFFHDGESIVRLDRETGKAVWRSEAVSRRSPIPTCFGPTLVVYEDVVLFAGGSRSMSGLSAETGEVLWTADHPPSGHNSPQDLLVLGGLAWAGAIAGGNHSGLFTGRDIHTGEVKSEFEPDVETYWFHHRCYRSKATDRYLLPSRTGIEFIDVAAKHWECHHWVRGGCIYGIMPCNGLIYAPPHSCACYAEAKLYGFCALGPEAAAGQPPQEGLDEERLERGPAYGDPGTPSPAGEDEWPTYRHDAARSGFTKSPVPAELTDKWERELGGKLSSVVVAGGKVFVASVDTHTMHALDADSGEVLWSYTVGGRVDSPPTVYQGRCLFGSADGWVYCLRAADGELIWRFRAAPEDRRLTAFEQVESVWPVHGSVLVQDGVIYCVAGRSMFLDGGLRLLRLDPRTGRKLSETILDDRDPETGENLQVRVKILNMPVALPDVLSSDGERIYMKSQQFDLQGVRQEIGPHSGDPAGQASEQAGETAHLFAPMGFVDDSWLHRSYWVYGRSFAGGHSGYPRAGHFAPAGRILVCDDASVYGYGRLPQYFTWTTPIDYHLFAMSKDIPVPERREVRGGDSRVSIQKSESINPAGTPLTVEAWVRAGGGDGVVIASGGPSHGYALYLKDGKPHFAIRVTNKLSLVSGEEEVAVGEWTHLAGVLTPDKKLQLYVNGKLAASAEAPGFIAEEPAQAMEIGADMGSAVGDYTSPFGFNGLIDEVRVYHRALDAEDIAKVHAAPGELAAGREALVVLLTFDHGGANDHSGNKNNGKTEKARAGEGKCAKAMGFGNRMTTQIMRPTLARTWAQEIPLHVRAMALADTTLFVAGPPDLIDEDEVFKNSGDPEVQAKLAEQSAALGGSMGALLWAVSASDGEKVSEYKLAAPPVFDGLAAARGRLYLSTIDGKVLCLGTNGS